MAQSVGVLRAEMEAGQARFGRDMGKARKHAKKFNDGTSRGFKKTSNVALDLTKSIKRSAAAILLIAGPAVLGIFVKNSIKAAGDAREAWSKFDAVFKDQAEATKRWALDFAGAVGRSTTEVGKWLSTLQDTFVPMGLARDEAAGLSKDLVKLAVDLGSFNDIADDQVILDFQSALVGNTETVRKYGIVINEANTKQEAYTAGIAKQGAKLTEQDKILARYNLILAGTADAQGDALRTSDSYNNQVKNLNSQIAALSETLGEQFLPAAGDAVVVIGDLVDVTDRWLKSENSAGLAAKFLITLMDTLSIAGTDLARIELELALAQEDRMKKSKEAHEADLEARLKEQESLKKFQELQGISTAQTDLEIARLKSLIGKKKENNTVTDESSIALAAANKAKEDEIARLKEAEMWLGLYHNAVREGTFNVIPDMTEANKRMEASIAAVRKEFGLVSVEMVQAGQIANVVGNLMEAAFAKPENQGEKLKQFVIGILNILETIVIAAGGANKGLTAIFAGPVGFGVIVASLVAIRGAKAVLNNMSFGDGGGFIVGGAGGRDNNQVSFNASRGEEVLVRTPAQVAAGAGTGGAGNQFSFYQTNRFEGITPEKFIDDTVAPQLEQMARDGVTELISTKNIKAGAELGGDLLRAGKG